ncbi:uncharacterized protein [Macrobrachium rosenbergii]|uniref:uncharacterized protein n=1 Tax=Macrobrachium rosenbergii TaxID=79674 RepID=UPI0034D5BC90
MGEYEVVGGRIHLGKCLARVKLVVHDHVDTPIHNLGLVNVKKQLEGKGYTLADSKVKSDLLKDINLLIGADYFGYFVTGMERIDGMNLFFTHNGVGLYRKTPQWALQGVVKSNVCTLRVQRIIENECDVDCWWRLDTLGISPDEQFTESEKTAMIQVQQSVVKTRLGYKVSLPFKGMQRLTNNYCNAAAQLSALEKQFQDPGYRKSYQLVLDMAPSSGFIEEVSDPQNYGYFMPHFGVRKESSTTPLRIVFNASSKRKGKLSLNDCLYAGPNLVELLYDLLLRFRSNPYAVISDISKAFL